MTADFYDHLAPFYHLMFADWEGAIERQGEVLARLLWEAGVAPGDEVLDASCGIGTQTLGLLARGFRVTASDISAGAIARLRTELAARGLQADTRLDDLRELHRAGDASLAAVLACDNSVPHLLDDTQIVQAFRSCLRCLRPGGIAIFSVRDYARIERRNPDLRPHAVRVEPDARLLAYQLWEWDGDQYDLHMYLTRDPDEGPCETRVFRSRYYAISVARLLQLLQEAGFTQARRLDEVFFQPLLTARRPG
ncbi:MAG TPA: class I SAM-dependent methyltransferase [Burkholderiaceae bacterium]|jgi:SAM-dependent methyltransferase|nr:class I SAM-dependent methyltransferase [Burkholderiaceae bacterium]